MPFQFRKEAIEEDLNTNFPSQGQGNPPLYYSLSEVVVPTYSINQVAEGSSLPQNLQTALDFLTTDDTANNSTVTIANTPGFYQVFAYISLQASVTGAWNIRINDGLGTKNIAGGAAFTITGSSEFEIVPFVVYLRSGDSLEAASGSTNAWVRVHARQLPDRDWETTKGTISNSELPVIE